MIPTDMPRRGLSQASAMRRPRRQFLGALAIIVAAGLAWLPPAAGAAGRYKVATAIAHEVRIGGSLYSDAMGPPGTYGGTYIGIIDRNVITIARSLCGTPPRGGIHGQFAEAGQ